MVEKITRKTRIIIQKSVFKYYPDLRFGFIIVKTPEKNNSQQINTLLRDITDLISLTFQKEKLTNHNLISSWKLAQAKFGNPQHYHTSVERLIQDILKRRSIKTKDPIHNLVRYISLKYIVPCSIDNLETLTTPITFTLATGNEKISLLKKLKKGALYYKDKEKILGTNFDYWKNKKTQTPSNHYLIHFTALPPITKTKLQKTIKELNTLLKTFCQAQTESFILDKNNSSNN